MVNFNDPAVVQADFRALESFVFAVQGVYIWEYFSTLWFEWDFITGEQPVSVVNMGLLGNTPVNPDERRVKLRRIRRENTNELSALGVFRIGQFVIIIHHELSVLDL
ncbi:hypothetical protein EDB83DRAFT_1940938 [Lactarius deliciosus]|nr:hypothetical protein EDB83DRAFT_1940938 [Lactarius deliciosus]